MESPQGVNVEAFKSSVRPIIEYDQSLQKEDVPYDVKVDPSKCTELFREFGMSDDAISKFKIRVAKKPLLRKSPLGKYSYSLISLNKDEITIYTDVLWKRFGNLGQAQTANNNNNHMQLFLEGIKTPFKKGASLVKAVSGGESKTPVGLFLHESKHASDFKGKIQKSLGIALKAIYYGGGTVGLGLMIDKSIPIAPLNEILSPLALFSLPFLYAADPYEIRARRFAVKNRNDPRWENILTLTPKEKK